MRLSCNGCRVLRKGCSEGCSIRPCLQWIKSPDAQANATVFLAKFYGRAGLMNLINAGPDNVRPAIFRSLLYEACGRIVNPIYGSVGLLWSGSWHMCQAAVEAVLKGAPIVQISDEAAAAGPTPAHLHKAYDIRHVSKPPSAAAAADSASSPPPPAADLHKVAKPGRTRFKRAAAHHKNQPKAAAAAGDDKAAKKPQPPRQDRGADEPMDGEDDGDDDDVMASGAAQDEHHRSDDDGDGSASPRASSGSHVADEEPRCGREASLDTEAGSHVSQAAPAGPAAAHQRDLQDADDEEAEQQLGLELTLGFAAAPAPASVARPATPAVDAGCGLRSSGAGEPGVLGFRFL
ncbi:hypothetical protein ACP4OV_028629 [Aristida adscensionis]